MKLKHFILAIPVILLAGCSNKNPESKGFELKGKLTNAHGEKIYLQQLSPEGLKDIDTATVNESGEFLMKAAIKEIGFYRLKITDRNFATLILNENDKITLNGDAADLGNTYTIDGSADSKLFLELNKELMTNYGKRDSLQRAFQALVNVPDMDSAKAEALSVQFEQPYTALIAESNTYLKNFIEKNTNSFAALAAIQQLPPDEFYETYKKLDESLSKKYPNSAYVKAFHATLEKQNQLNTGSVAPEINLNTPEGKPLALSSLKGKIVLIDFWASWCGPCRVENPVVVAAYKKYASKGFDIYSVSLDKDKDKWEAAIKKDGLTWKSHVSDLKFWQSPVVALYNFNAIPTNFLIDREGKIIAKNLRGIDLENKLAELFK